jgi:hypothetical protein
MGQYGESYLQNWDEALQGEAPNATEVVDAFNELAYAVTGPTGFWRATLPNNWLGCRQDPSSAPCLKLTGAQPELARWDEIQENLSNMPERQAGTFLRRNKRSILAYFDNYVPQEPSSSAMKQTLYYQEHLIGLLD